MLWDDLIWLLPRFRDGLSWTWQWNMGSIKGWEFLSDGANISWSSTGIHVITEVMLQDTYGGYKVNGYKKVSDIKSTQPFLCKKWQWQALRQYFPHNFGTYQITMHHIPENFNLNFACECYTEN